jgi:hypothetical protein
MANGIPSYNAEFESFQRYIETTLKCLIWVNGHVIMYFMHDIIGMIPGSRSYKSRYEPRRGSSIETAWSVKHGILAFTPWDCLLFHALYITEVRIKLVVVLCYLNLAVACLPYEERL